MSDGGAAAIFEHPIVSGVVSGVVVALILYVLLPLRSYETWRKDLRESAHWREEAARRLEATDWAHLGALYQNGLDRALGWADGFFGPALSQRAFATCVVIALIYAWLGFWLAYAVGAPDALGATDLGLPEDYPGRALLGLGVPALCIGGWLIGWLLGRWERRRKADWLQRRLEAGDDDRRARRTYAERGALWAVGWLIAVTVATWRLLDVPLDIAPVVILLWTSFLAAPVIVGTAAALRWRRAPSGWTALVAGAGGVAAAVAGAGAGAVAVAGAGAGGVAVAASVGVARGVWGWEGRVAWLAGIGVLAAWATLFLVAGGGDETVLILVAFFLIIPVLNAVLDAVSWVATRLMLGHLRGGLASRATAWRRALVIAGHTLADIALAVVSLFALAWLLAFAFEWAAQQGMFGAIDSADGAFVRGMVAAAAAAPFRDGL